MSTLAYIFPFNAVSTTAEMATHTEVVADISLTHDESVAVVHNLNLASNLVGVTIAPKTAMPDAMPAAVFTDANTVTFSLGATVTGGAFRVSIKRLLFVAPSAGGVAVGY